MIVDKQQHLGWGNSVVKQLSKDIQEEYPGIQGFSERNLWNMRLFCSELQQNKKLQPLVAEVSYPKLKRMGFLLRRGFAHVLIEVWARKKIHKMITK